MVGSRGSGWPPWGALGGNRRWRRWWRPVGRYRCGEGMVRGMASYIEAGRKRGLRDWSKRSVAGADKKLHPKKVSPLPLRTPDRTGPPVRQPPIGAPRSPRTSQPNLGYTLFLPTNPFARRNTENCSETNSTYPPLPPSFPLRRFPLFWLVRLFRLPFLAR